MEALHKILNFQKNLKRIPKGPQKNTENLERVLNHWKEFLNIGRRCSRIFEEMMNSSFVVLISLWLRLFIMLMFFFLSRSGNMRHSPSEPVLHQRSHSTSRSSSLTRNRPDLTTPIHVPKMKSSPMNSILPSSYFSMNSHELIPSLPDKSSNLDPDDFLPVLTDMFQQTNSKS